MRKLFITGLLLVGLGFMAMSQTAKFGHIDLAQLVQAMPEMKQAQDSMQAAQAEMERTLSEYQTELENMGKKFAEEGQNWTEDFKLQQQQTYQQMLQRAQEYQQGSQQRLQMLEQELFAPVLQKAKDAVAAVAKKKQLTYVFNYNEQASMLLYASPGSTDLLPEVKKELGILSK